MMSAELQTVAFNIERGLSLTGDENGSGQTSYLMAGAVQQRA